MPGEGDIVKVLGLGGQPTLLGRAHLPSTWRPDPRFGPDRRLPRPAALPRPPGNRRGAPGSSWGPANNVAFNAIPKAGALHHHGQRLPPAAGRRPHRADRPSGPRPWWKSSFGSNAPTPPRRSNSSTARLNSRRPNNPGQAGDDEQRQRRSTTICADPSGALATTGNPWATTRTARPGFYLRGEQRLSPSRAAVTLTADVRTNRVHVVTSPVNIPRIEQLLEEYDADTPFRHPRAAAVALSSARKDVLPILVQALTEPGSDSGGQNGSQPHQSAPAPRTRTGAAAARPAAISSAISSGSSSSGGSGGSGAAAAAASARNRGWTPSPSTRRPRKPPSATPNSSPTSATTRSSCSAGRRPRTRCTRCSTSWTCARPQVVIRTVIGELSLTDGKEFGLNYLLRSNRGSILSQFNGSQLQTTTAGTGTTGGTTHDSTSTTGVDHHQRARIGTSYQPRRVRLLDTLSTLATGIGGPVVELRRRGRHYFHRQIVRHHPERVAERPAASRPSAGRFIFTSNNKKAIIASGQEIAFPTQPGRLDHRHRQRRGPSARTRTSITRT